MRWRLTPSRARPGWLTLIGPRDDDFKADLMERVPKHLREYCPPPSILVVATQRPWDEVKDDFARLCISNSPEQAERLIIEAAAKR
jgi:hypothetical protein